MSFTAEQHATYIEFAEHQVAGATVKHGTEHIALTKREQEHLIRHTGRQQQAFLAGPQTWLTAQNFRNELARYRNALVTEHRENTARMAASGAVLIAN